MDALGDGARHLVHREVRNLARVHEDADFAPCGDCVHLFDAFEARGEALEVAQALEIPLDRVAAGSRAATLIASATATMIASGDSYGYSS